MLAAGSERHTSLRRRARRSERCQCGAMNLDRKMEATDFTD